MKKDNRVLKQALYVEWWFLQLTSWRRTNKVLPLVFLLSNYNICIYCQDKTTFKIYIFFCDLYFFIHERIIWDISVISRWWIRRFQPIKQDWSLMCDVTIHGGFHTATMMHLAVTVCRKGRKNKVDLFPQNKVFRLFLMLDVSHFKIWLHKR